MKLSIIIPNYNNSLLLKQCIESTDSLGDKNVEIILVDDASTDSSNRYFENFEKYKNFKVIKNKNNLGLGLTRNVGIEFAKGE